MATACGGDSGGARDGHPPTVVDGSGGDRGGRGGEAPSPPPSFGDYRIIREVGRGGMGVVYEAWQISLRRRVALKVLSHGLGDPRRRRRFEREARAAGRLHHTNIVPVFGVGEHEGIPYYVMQFIRGVGLDAVLDGSRIGPPEQPDSTADLTGSSGAWRTTTGSGRGPGPMDPTAFSEIQIGGRYSETVRDPKFRDVVRSLKESESSPPSPPPPLSPPPGEGRELRDGLWKWIADLGAQAAAGLAYAHSQDVLHRDVKPSNLLLDERGTVWVTDFGLAKWGDHHDLTQSDDVVGTLRYMPPEALDGVSGPSSDVYGLGLTLYELLARRPAFDESDRARLIRQVADASPPPLWKLDPAIPLDLATVVHKAIEKLPKDRYAEAADLEADLRRFLNDMPVRARRVSPFERYLRWARRNPAVAVLGGVLAAVLLLATAGSMIAAGWFRGIAAESDRARLVADAALKESEATQELMRLMLYDTQSNLASAAWISGDYAQFRSLLDQMRPQPGESDLRGWEWRYLDRLDGEARLTIRTPGEQLVSVSVHPDGSSFATLALNGVIRVWNTVDGAPGLVIPAAPNQPPTDLRHGVHAVSHSPDGSLLVGPAAGGAVGIYDAGTGKLLRRLEVDRVAVLSFSWSPDGSRLAASFSNHTVRFWRVATGDELPNLPGGHDAPIAMVELSRDGRLAATAGLDGLVELWRLEEEPVLLQTLVGHEGEVLAIAFSTDGRGLASAGLDGTIRLWDVASGVQRTVIQAHEGGVLCLAYSGVGGWLASGGNDDAVRIWDPLTGRQRRRFLGHTQGVRALAAAPDGESLVSVSTEGIVRVWDPYGSPMPRTLHDVSVLRYGGGASCVDVSPDGLLAASGHDDQIVRVWDVASGVLLHQLKGHDSRVRAVAFSPDGRFLASCCGNPGAPPGSRGVVLIWDLATAKAIRGYAGHHDVVDALVFLNDGSWLASAGGDRKVHIWNAETGEVRRILEGHENAVRCMAFDPKRGLLASGATDWTVRLWDVSTGESRGTIRTDGEVWALALSPDESSLAVAQNNGPLRIWSLADLAPVATLKGHDLDVTSLLYTSERRLISGGRDKTVRVWDVKTKRSVLTLKRHSEAVTGLALSPNGDFLATSSRDRTIRLWQTSPAQ